MGQQKGSTKKRKGDQPKRKRYIANRRQLTNAVRNLTRHMKKYSAEGQDAQAKAALKRLEDEL